MRLLSFSPRSNMLPALQENMPPGFFQSLKVAASGPYALVAYVILVAAWLYFATSSDRLRGISKIISLIPKEHRKGLLEGEYRTLPRHGLSPEQWIASRRMTLLFLGFLALVIAGSTITILALTLYAPHPSQGDDPCKGPNPPMHCLG
jgi:hypothetical protein